VQALRSVVLTILQLTVLVSVFQVLIHHAQGFDTLDRYDPGLNWLWGGINTTPAFPLRQPVTAVGICCGLDEA
jgi:hypothetical protein